MSGIAGVILFKDVGASNQVKAMTSYIEHRGKDGIGYWQSPNNSVAFSTLLLKASMSSYNQKGVYETNGYSITADVRLDNRTQLLSELGYTESETSDKITDPELLLKTYLKCGNDCVDKFLGDFAFVIYDPTDNSIFMSRDVMGVRPLFYYYKEGEVLAFASEIKALFALDYVSRTLNNEMVALYLCKAGDFRPYKGDTIYKNIKGVKPAFYCHITSKFFTEDFYWKLNLERFDTLKTEDEYIEAFKKTWIQAVKCRINTPEKVGGHLSGGLDSSSVSATAAMLLANQNRQIDTFHMDVEEPRCDERDYAEAVAEKHKNINLFYTRPKDYDFFEACKYFSEMSSIPPYYAVTPQAQIGWMKAAKEKKCRVFLTGHEGDTVVDYGKSFMFDSLRNEDWDLFEKLLQDFSKQAVHYRFFDDISDKTYQQKLDLVRFLTVSNVLSVYKHQKKYRKIASYFLWSKRSLIVVPYYLKKLKVQTRLKKSLSRYGVIKTEFLEESKIDLSENEDLRIFFSDLPVPEKSKVHFERIYCYGMTKFCEILENNGMYHGFKVAHPFLDRRILELSLIIPSKINFNKGYLRGVMREAMKGILPEKVRLRTDKTDFTPFLSTTLTKFNQDFKDLITKSTTDHTELKAILNTQNIFQKLKIAIDPSETTETKERVYFGLLRVIYFIIFFNNLNTFKHEKENVQKTPIK